MVFNRRRILALSLLAGVACCGIVGWRSYRRRETARWLDEAISAAHAGNSARAVSLLDAVLRRDSEHPKALVYRAQLARDDGQRDLALDLLRRVNNSSPKEAGTARYVEGTMAIEDNHARLAEALYLESIVLHPTYRQPREALAQVYVNQWRGPEIRETLDGLRQLRELDIEELIVYTDAMIPNHTPEEVIPRLEAWVRADPADLASLVALCRYCLVDDRIEQALRLLQQALENNPEDERFAALLAEAYVLQSNGPAALALLNRFPATARSHSWLWRSHGLASFAEGNWARAAVCLERALAAEPEDIAVAYKLGQAWERIGRHSAADRLLRHSRLMERLALQTFRLRVSDRKRTDLLVGVVYEISQTALELGRCHEAAAWAAVATKWYPDDPSLAELWSKAQKTAAGSPPWPGDLRLLLAELSDSVRRDPPHPQKTAAAHTVIKESAALQPPATVRLTDCHAEAGLDFQYVNGQSEFKYLIETLGGGVAVVDYDGDGWPDLYFAQGGPIPLDASHNPYSDRLYRNLGDGTFRDVTFEAGLGDRQYSQGCTAGDYDNDGDADLVIANYGTNVFYRNNGDGTFTEATRFVGLGGEHFSSSLAFADLDRDGNLDLYIVNYVLEALKICRTNTGRMSTCSPANFAGEDDILYRNAGDGTFVDVSATAGILAADGKGLGIVVADLDNDDWPDVFVANDGTPNFLFRNLGSDGKKGLRFSEIGMTAGCAVNADGSAQAGMGIACGDLDGDGLLDLFVTHFFREYATLYRNLGAMLFEDASRAANLVERTHNMLGFGTQAIDFDLDGSPDLFVANGHIDDFRFRNEPWKMPPQLFINRGGLKFDDGAPAGGDYFQGEYLGRGVARLDFNRDGRPDVVVVHQDRPAALLRNDTQSAGNAVALDLHGVESNRDAIGARITWRCGPETRICEICGGDGFLARNERRLVLGLGSATQIDSLEIRWPRGRIDRWEGIPANSSCLMREGRDPIIRPICPSPH